MEKCSVETDQPREEFREVPYNDSNEPGRQSGKKERGNQEPDPATLISQRQCIVPPVGQGEPLKHFRQRCDSENWDSKWEAEVGIRKDGGLSVGAKGGHIGEI